MSSPLRPARLNELAQVHAWLKAALAETFPHVPEFMAREAARFSQTYLRALSKANPSHVFMVEQSGLPVGFMLSGPEQGNLVYYWGYIDPAHRKGALAAAAMAQFTQHWDKSRFHKITAFTTAQNRVAQLLMQRLGYRQVALLEKHIYGQDFLQFEKMLEKALPGYDEGVGLSLKAQIKARVEKRLSRS